MNEQQRSVIQQALEALEVASSCVDGYYLPEGKILLPEVESAVAALRQLLKHPEPVQEPVFTYDQVKAHIQAALISTAQPAAWVGLTDDEQDEIAAYHGLDCMVYEQAFRAIEAKLREKNGGGHA
jgi:hypothetical protein